MVPVIVLLVVIVVGYVVVDHMNTKRLEAKGICKTTGSTCTSPTGCTCDSKIPGHDH